MPEVKNLSQAPQGVRTQKGLIWLAPGESRTLNLDDNQMERVNKLAADNVLGVSGKAVGGERIPGYVAPPPIAEPTLLPPEPPVIVQDVYEARHKGGGKYSIFKNGEEFRSGLSKEAVEGFNDLDGATQAAVAAALPVPVPTPDA